MSVPQRAPRPARSSVLTDADLLELFGRDSMSRDVLLVVRMRSRGSLQVEAKVKAIAEKLGVDRRTVQRALRRIEAAGVPVIHRTGSAGDSICHVFVLDRRRVPDLRDEDELRPRLEIVQGAECREGAAPAPRDIGLKNPQGVVGASFVGSNPPPEGRVEARAGPRPSESPPGGVVNRGETEAERSPLPTVPSPEPPGLPPASELEPELSELRDRLGRRQRLGTEQEPGDRLRLTRAAKWLVAHGRPLWRVELARLHLAAELGITRPGVAGKAAAVDNGGNDCGDATTDEEPP